MMQGRNNAAGSQLHLARDHGQRGTDDRRIGVKTAKCMEMSFRHPQGFEVVFVRKLRAIHQQTVVFLTRTRSVTVKIKRLNFIRMIPIV